MKRIAQIVVAVVFVVNASCAIAFVFQPEAYAGGFEMEGLAGRIFVRALGILFLVWNVTYPLVIFDPVRFKHLFAIVLIQQAIGGVGETWLMLTIPAGHPALLATGLRFIVFDGVGLIAMSIVYWLLHLRR